jgi:hypothetical protein
MKLKFFILLSPILFTVNAPAWDSFGHMAVAFVAYQNLTAPTKQRVNDLLKLNPQFQTWDSWIPTGTKPADHDTMIFMFAATWPDEIKGQKFQTPPINPVSGNHYVADGSDGGNRPDGSPNPTANQGFSDDSMHKYWHFIDKPFSRDGSQLPPIPTPNAQERIALFRAVLGSNSADKLKSYDLAWVLHLVGDVHQPLHCATRVSQTDLKGDSGGNNVSLGNNSELHAFWDDVLGTGNESKVAKSVIKKAKALPTPDPVLAADGDEKDWVDESFQNAQQKVYVSPPIGDGDGPFSLTSGYRKSAKTVAQQRMALAGVRLANLINTNLK